ncbi:hypothetical protein QJS04_geneDACA015474 [Acorus gramineus]|uniref:Snurportin-1 n=1 Tax=Acorus gramineus TaxID=55184 RepID=A0AAV9A520_ACOGR|nr:hypothetical protein QJS04_geneDACA015474 [Acorus gramineus]
MAPGHDLRRPYKRAAITDQERRRVAALRRQEQQRADSQHRARCLASSVLSLPSGSGPTSAEPVGPVDPAEPWTGPEEVEMEEEEEPGKERDLNAARASRMSGPEVRRWFARQLMLPEWMIDVPTSLRGDWYVFPRPAGNRCFVVSSNGTTVSRARNGSILHHFPSALPNGARTKDVSGPSSSFSILDCIFHEPDLTYYVIDMVCWRGYSLYDCTAEFRFFWLNSKLMETGACNPPSRYHKYKFSVVPIYDCDQAGLESAYMGPVPYTKDGLSFYNKHAHYQTGNTPLALMWKDDKCSQHVLDTDGKGQVPAQQQVVLELQDDGKLVTSDDPPVIFGCLDGEFVQKLGLRSGNLLRFAVSDDGIRLVNEKLEVANIHYIARASRARAFADSYSKVLFQHAARHSPLKFEDLIASLYQCHEQDSESTDIEMA